MACGGKISKAGNTEMVSGIFNDLSKKLSGIDELNYVKIYKGKILAPNALTGLKKICLLLKSD